MDVRGNGILESLGSGMDDFPRFGDDENDKSIANIDASSWMYDFSRRIAY